MTPSRRIARRGTWHGGTWHRGVLLTLLFALSCTLAAGCTRRATQLMLVMDSDLDPSLYTCIGIEVARLADGRAVMPSQYVSFNIPTQTGLPFSLGVLPPGGDASVRVEIRAEARAVCLDPNTTTMIPPPVVRTVIRAGFASEQTLRLPLFLAELCRGVTCGEGSTCGPTTGVCEPVPNLSSSQLTPVRPGEELLDAALAGDAGAPSDAGTLTDANLIGGQCPLEIDDLTTLADAPPRVFGLTITQPGDEWVVLYADAGSLHAVRYAYDDWMRSDVPSWALATDADAIALEGLAGGDSLLALVNPPGSSELVRYTGPLQGSAPVSSSLGTARLVQRGRHSALLGDRIAVIVERGANLAVLAVGATDMPEYLYESVGPVDLALGNTATGELVLAIGGASCELRTFDTSGAMIGTSTATTVGACGARAVARLTDGNYALVYATDTSQLRLHLTTSPTDGMSLRLDQGAHVSPIAAVLGNDYSFRVGWSDIYDYPAAPEPGPLEPGIVYWTGFGPGDEVSEYTDHGDATTDHDLTRWERRGERTALVMTQRNGLLFRSLCRPTPAP